MAPSATLLATLKAVHVVGAVLFVGNVVVTGAWTALAFRARDRVDFRFAARAIVVTDWIFTVGGGAVLVTSGTLLAMGRGYPIWDTPWIRQALLALGVSMAAWLAVLVPAQGAMLRIPRHDDAALRRAYHRWNAVGWAATAPLLYAIWCMVAKPA